MRVPPAERRFRVYPPLNVSLPLTWTCGRGLGAIPSGRNDSADPCREPRCVTTRVAAAERRFRGYPPYISLSLRNGPAAGVSERFRPGRTRALCLAETPDGSRREPLRPNMDSGCTPPACQSSSDTDLRPGSRSDSVLTEGQPGVWPRPQTCHDASRSGRTSIPSGLASTAVSPAETLGGLGPTPRQGSVGPVARRRDVTSRGRVGREVSRRRGSETSSAETVERPARRLGDRSEGVRRPYRTCTLRDVAVPGGQECLRLQTLADPRPPWRRVVLTASPLGTGPRSLPDVHRA